MHLKLSFSAWSLVVLSMSSGRSTTEFDAPPKHWESEDSFSKSRDVSCLLRGMRGFISFFISSDSKSRDVSCLLRGLGGFLSFFFSSGLNSNTDGTLPGTYVFLPIPKDTRICFGLKWNSQTITFFRFTKFISSSSTPISLNNLQPFLTLCWIFRQFKQSNVFTLFSWYRSSRPEVFCKKCVLKNFTKFSGKHLCQSLFFNKVADLRPIKEETLAQMFSYEFWEILKNTIFTEHLWWVLPIIVGTWHPEIQKQSPKSPL